MKKLRILLIDDQYARDDEERSDLLNDTNTVEAGYSKSRHIQPLAEVVFCSGQVIKNNNVVNDYAVIYKAVKKGWQKDRKEWALVLLDVRFDSGELDEAGTPSSQEGDNTFGEQVRGLLKQDFPSLPVVMLSSKKQVELNNHQTPYLSKKGLSPHQLSLALLRYGQINKEQTRYLLKLDDDVVVEAPSTVAIYLKAFTHAPNHSMRILISGESGTGKELLARYIHRLSGVTGEFVGLNIAALDEGLQKSALFGHEKGSFTGAGKHKIGHFEQAINGTLFFDEIGDIAYSLQTDLLRVLQENEILRVGGETAIKVNPRLVSATKHDVLSLVREGKFREDFYARIHDVILKLPPLRERREEIPALALRFLAHQQELNNKEGIEFSESAIEALCTYDYPLNVRELESTIKYLVSDTGNNQIISAESVNKVLGSSRITEQAVVSKATPSTTVAQGAKQVTLDGLTDLLANISIDQYDHFLEGAFPKLDAAFLDLKQRLAGAVLESYRDPRTRKINRQGAIQTLMNDRSLKGKEPGRILCKVLARKLTDKIADDDLELLVTKWRQRQQDENP